MKSSRHRLAVAFAFVLGACATSHELPDAQPDASIATRTLPEVLAALDAGDVTSEQLVQSYLDRIDDLDRNGPTLRSVLALNPNALEDARASDVARAANEDLGPLHGAPILIKDNIETADDMPTTAGSMALIDNYATTDAPLVANLRSAGAIILGKTNLSEWANFRSNESISGWSQVGGQTRNPHVLDRNPCGSSSGSGAATAASLAAGSVGTETNGSIICPSTMNGVVGFKPTVGLVSQEQIVPISSTQDTAGPMTRSVEGAAIMLTAMATGDRATDFAATLSSNGLDGLRVGVLRFAVGEDPRILDLFEQALGDIETAGGTLVDIDDFDEGDSTWTDEFLVLKAEFRSTLNAYLDQTPLSNETRSLEDVISFNQEYAAAAPVLFDQDILEATLEAPALTDETYIAARDRILTATRENGIDQLMSTYDVDVLVAPSSAPAFLIDPVHGDSYPGGAGAGWMAAIAGYPHLTVPMGDVLGLPVGVSFMGGANDDARVLTVGYAYEKTSNRRIDPQFRQTVDDIDHVTRAQTPASDR